MDIAYKLAQYLQNSGFGTVGTSIFVGQIPSETNGVYIIRTGGQLQDYIPIEETVLDIYIKNTKSQTAVQDLEVIKRHIHRMHNTTLSDVYIYAMLVIGDVETVDRDLEYAKLYKITVSIRHRATALLS